MLKNLKLDKIENLRRKSTQTREQHVAICLQKAIHIQNTKNLYQKTTYSTHKNLKYITNIN